MTGKDIVPELVQRKFTVENIVYETEKLLYDKEYREENIALLGEVKNCLSEKYSAQEVAEAIWLILQ